MARIFYIYIYIFSGFYNKDVGVPFMEGVKLPCRRALPSSRMDGWRYWAVGNPQKAGDKL